MKLLRHPKETEHFIKMSRFGGETKEILQDITWSDCSIETETDLERMDILNSWALVEADCTATQIQLYCDGMLIVVQPTGQSLHTTSVSRSEFECRTIKVSFYDEPLYNMMHVI